MGHKLTAHRLQPLSFGESSAQKMQHYPSLSVFLYICLSLLAYLVRKLFVDEKPLPWHQMSLAQWQLIVKFHRASIIFNSNQPCCELFIGWLGHCHVLVHFDPRKLRNVLNGSVSESEKCVLESIFNVIESFEWWTRVPMWQRFFNVIDFEMGSGGRGVRELPVETGQVTALVDYQRALARNRRRSTRLAGNPAHAFLINFIVKKIIKYYL